MDMEKRVLIVDDSSISRMLLRGLIKERRPEWNIAEARNADEALLQALEETPDLVTLDITMPGKSGLDLALELKAQCPDAKLALVTANIQDSVRRKIQDLGILFVGVVEKPATPAAVDKMLYYVDAG